MRPIPRWMLPHTAQLYTEAARDSWQQITWGEPVTLQNVRIEHNESLAFDANNQQYRRAAVFFFDAHNSRPSDVAFERGQKLTAFGKEFKIMQIEPLYDERGLHHYEIYLI